MKQFPVTPSSHPQRPNQYQGSSDAVPPVDDGTFIRKDAMPTEGDLIATQAGEPARVAIGTEGDVLTVSGGVPTWAPSAGSVLYEPVTNGDPSSPELVFADGDVVMAPAP